MMNDDKILQEIIFILNENYHIDPKKIINSESRIEEDLLITGDDAVEFIVKFGKHFNVDVSNFMAADYFEGEGIVLFPFFKKKREKKVLTVGD